MDSRSVTSRRGQGDAKSKISESSVVLACWSSQASNSRRGLMRPVAVAVVLVAEVDVFGRGQGQMLRRRAPHLVRSQIAFLVDRVGNAVEHGSVVTESRVHFRRIATVVVLDGGGL